MTTYLFHAKGNTYEHRQWFGANGWHWDADDKVWFLETDDKHDPRMIQAKELDGVRITLA